jgi:hypothetical protein
MKGFLEKPVSLSKMHSRSALLLEFGQIICVLNGKLLATVLP